MAFSHARGTPAVTLGLAFSRGGVLKFDLPEYGRKSSEHVPLFLSCSPFLTHTLSLSFSLSVSCSLARALSLSLSLSLPLSLSRGDSSCTHTVMTRWHSFIQRCTLCQAVLSSTFTSSTGVPRSAENIPPWDPTVALCLGPCSSPRGGAVFYERITPVLAFCIPRLGGGSPRPLEMRKPRKTRKAWLQKGDS